MVRWHQPAGVIVTPKVLELAGIRLLYWVISGEPGGPTCMETSLDGAETTNAVEKQHKPNEALKDESDAVGLATRGKVKLTVVQFEEESQELKWLLRSMSVLLIICLVYLWIYYR